MAFKMKSNPMKRNFGIKLAKKRSTAEQEQEEYAKITSSPGNNLSKELTPRGKVRTKKDELKK